MLPALERFPIERNRSIDQNSLQIKKARAVSDPIGSETALGHVLRLAARRRAARLRRRRGARRGFTLIESLVAFMILTLSMGALMQGLGGGARNEARGDFLLRAAREGRSQLEALGVATPLTQGETSGRYGDGLAWRLSVRQIRDAAGADGAGRTIAFLARLIVRRPGEGPTESLTLTTVKLAAMKPRQ